MQGLNIDITPGRRKAKGRGLKWVFGSVALAFVASGVYLYAPREKLQGQSVVQLTVTMQASPNKPASSAQAATDPNCKYPPTWKPEGEGKVVCFMYEPRQ